MYDFDEIINWNKQYFLQGWHNTPITYHNTQYSISLYSALVDSKLFSRI